MLFLRLLFLFLKLRLKFKLSTVLASFFALVAVAIISMFTSTMSINTDRVDVTLFTFINCKYKTNVNNPFKAKRITTRLGRKRTREKIITLTFTVGSTVLGGTSTIVTPSVLCACSSIHAWIGMTWRLNTSTRNSRYPCTTT